MPLVLGEFKPSSTFRVSRAMRCLSLNKAGLLLGVSIGRNVRGIGGLGS